MSGYIDDGWDDLLGWARHDKMVPFRGFGKKAKDNRKAKSRVESLWINKKLDHTMEII